MIIVLSLFNSVYTGASATVNPLMVALSLLVSLILGAALAWVHRYRTLYTKEFVITLTILPSLLSVIIFLVNGSLGTSVAVAGTFSLVRFRSAAGGARELLALFLAMTIGLSTGMGYLTLAILTTIVFLVIWLGLEKMTFFSSGQTVRHLVIDLPKDRKDEKLIRHILHQFCRDIELVSLKSSHSGEHLTLTYQIDLNSDDDDVLLTDELVEHIVDIDISMTKLAKKKKNL